MLYDHNVTVKPNPCKHFTHYSYKKGGLAWSSSHVGAALATMGCGMVLFQVMSNLPFLPVDMLNLFLLLTVVFYHPSHLLFIDLSTPSDVLLPKVHRYLLWKGLSVHFLAPMLCQRRGRRRAS